MIFPNNLGAPEWLVPFAILLGFSILLIGWSYWRSESSTPWKLLLGGLKIAALALLGLFLLEPVYEFEQVEPGSNLMIIMADKSQSLQIKDRGSSKSRMELMKTKLDSASWLDQLEEQFEVRKYVFDSKLQAVPDYANLVADGQGSSIMSSLRLAAQRYRNRPLAGILLFSDGNATDWDADFDFDGLPPVYVVTAGKSAPAKDIGLTEIAISQTNFESAPVTITAESMAHGYGGKTVVARLLAANGDEIQRQEIIDIKDETPFAVRFQLKPEDKGVNIYRVEVNIAGDDELANEATVLNNSRQVVVDRGKGPFRVLYVTGTSQLGVQVSSTLNLGRPRSQFGRADSTCQERAQVRFSQPRRRIDQSAFSRVRK